MGGGGYVGSRLKSVGRSMDKATAICSRSPPAARCAVLALYSHWRAGCCCCCCASDNKMQSGMADFVPVPPPPGELDETYAPSLIRAHSLHYMENATLSTKPEVHNVSHCRQRRNDPRSQTMSGLFFSSRCHSVGTEAKQQFTSRRRV